MYVVLWLLGSLVVGFIGRNRTFGFFGFFLASLIVSPIVVLIILLATGPDPKKSPESNQASQISDANPKHSSS